MEPNGLGPNASAMLPLIIGEGSVSITFIARSPRGGSCSSGTLNKTGGVLCAKEVVAQNSNDIAARNVATRLKDLIPLRVSQRANLECGMRKSPYSVTDRSSTCVLRGGITLNRTSVSGPLLFGQKA